FRGFGLDLADLREYQYGDDVRHIDWNVTARLQQPYVREYHEDREITAWFLLDLSRSIDFGSQEVKKATVAADVVALVARLHTWPRRGPGSRDRRATVRRHARRQLPQALHRSSTDLRASRAHRANRSGGRHARAVHRRQPRRQGATIRGPAQAQGQREGE